MAFSCEKCSATFGLQKTLNRHLKANHGNQTFQCGKCDYTTNQKDNLKHHVESKHFGNKFLCTHCPFSCERKDSLNRHIRTYHEVEKDPLAPTPGFDWAEDVEQEERIQNKEKFTCPQCPSVLYHKSTLNRHVNSVHGKKEFKCGECDLTFNRVDAFRRHEPIH